MGTAAAIMWAASALLTALALHSGFCLLRNYQAARSIGDGLPIRIIPISPLNPVWMLLDTKILAFVKKLPFGLGNNSFTRYNWRGWEVADRCKSHDEMGDVFLVVNPFRNWLYIANPEAVVEVLKKSKEFPHDAQLTAMLDVFGPNISTALGENWRKQRKITASCFNDLNNEVVWSETVTQAQDMLRYWTGAPNRSIATIADDTRTLTLNVMARAGFGQSFHFEGRDEQKSPPTDTSVEISYRDSLQIILENCILILALGPKFLSKPWLPRKLQRLHKACDSFQKHMTTVYEEAKRALVDSQVGGQRNLMASLVRASQRNEADHKLGTGGGSGGLTEPEIYGNMFVFNFAGHDTTSHTFTFAIYFLAANPKVQDWMSEEIRAVFGHRPQNEWTASADFPRLKRCIAVLYETLRLYLPVPPCKWTEDGTQTLRVGDKTLVIPPNTMINPSYVNLQTNPEWWGAESQTWHPQRWIKNPGSVDGDEAGRIGPAGDEELITPVRGTFLGWSEGARDCPGRKFSQVEFVATLATLFKDWRVEPVVRDDGSGETPELARKRVLEFIEEDTGYVLLLQMKHPERCPLVWKKRED